jgi:hypothetical protein
VAGAAPPAGAASAGAALAGADSPVTATRPTGASLSCCSAPLAISSFTHSSCVAPAMWRATKKMMIVNSTIAPSTIENNSKKRRS